MIISLMIGAFCLVPVQSATDSLVDDLLQESGFSKRVSTIWHGRDDWALGKKDISLFASSRKSEQGRKVSWLFYTRRKDRASRGLIGSPPGGYKGFMSHLPSQLPIGGEGISLVTDKEVRIVSASLRETISLNYITDEFIENPITNEEITWFEHLAREIMARGAGLRLDSPTSTQVGGVTVHGYSCRFSKLPFVNLTDWASSQGWTTSLSEDKNAMTLSKESHTVLIPLSAMSIRVDGYWRELPDVVAEKEGAWYVPASSLTAL